MEEGTLLFYKRTVKFANIFQQEVQKTIVIKQWFWTKITIISNIFRFVRIPYIWVIKKVTKMNSLVTFLLSVLITPSIEYWYKNVLFVSLKGTCFCCVFYDLFNSLRLKLITNTLIHISQEFFLEINWKLQK